MNLITIDIIYIFILIYTFFRCLTSIFKMKEATAQSETEVEVRVALTQLQSDILNVISIVVAASIIRCFLGW